MSKQIPRKIPQPSPNWLDFLPANYNKAPVTVTLQNKRRGEREGNETGDYTRQEAVNASVITLDDATITWSGGGGFASYQYLLAGAPPNRSCNMGEVLQEYDFDASVHDLEKLWPFVRDISIEIEWDEAEDIEPRSYMIATGTKRANFQVLDVAADVWLPDLWVARPVLTLQTNEGFPRVLEGIDLVLNSVQLKPTATINFHEITNQTEFDFVWDPDWKNRDVTIKAQSGGHAPMATPVFPAVRDGAS